ncbi:MAG: ThiF family adenylyltransferase [Chitinophagales bacterium]
MSIFYHEELYRSNEALQKMKRMNVVICGAGALGGNIAESLARSGFGQLKVIDFDRIEERNLSTQPYQKADIGAFKAKMVANNLYRAVGARVEAVVKRLEENNVHKLLRGSDLVIDVFDNSVSRQVVKDYCLDKKMPCLHVGLAGDYAEVIWNELYRVPSATNDDVCDYPLARNLVTLATSVACEVIVGFASKGLKESYTITLGDFAVKRFE